VSETGHVEIVLAAVRRNGRICLARRSQHVATSRGLWSVVTGYVEPGVDPLAQAWDELVEELGLKSPDVELLARLEPLPLTSPASGKRFLVYPFLFEAASECQVVLNWEHSDQDWVEPERLAQPDCVAWQRDIVLALLQQASLNRC
jgi:8-oxo-dGTP pyrophosphatase MutT (NUDIX family)